LAIYRGAGGAGDAVGDASSEVLLALQAKDAAVAAQVAAEAAQAAAELAETNAETAETNAETAETNAETAETNAETAATNAASSASAASTSATNAAASASTATTQATNAASSASAASTSASNASTSATNAASSASTATTQATNASNSASAAATSATNASNSASSASTSATNASNSATAAQTAETNAETAETNAAASASAASTSATNASNSASAASTSATNASNSASAASTSATNASNSASSASTSATNAASAQTAAESARDATLAAYDSFDDRYLGAKSAAPSLDNDGNALVGGALYFDTVSQGMKVYTGSVWVDAYVPGSTYLAKANNLSDLTNTGTARTNLGVAIGTDVQAYDAQLADVAGLTPTDNNFIVGNGTNFVTESGSTARTSLGLGSIATQDSSNITVTGGTINSTAIGGTTAAAGKFTTLEATGVTTVQAGTVSLPAITTTGDTNTGIFFPAADTIAFTEGGVEAMRIDSGGNLLVGRTSSLVSNVRAEFAITDTSTSISSGIGAAISIQNLSTTNNTYSTIYFTNGGGGVDSAIYGLHEVGNGTSTGRTGSLVFATANLGGGVSERVRIDSSGNVGIGTSTITSGAGWTPRLVLSGTSAAAIVKGINSQEVSVGSSDGMYIDCLGNTTGSNNNIIFRNTASNSTFSASERMRINASGYLKASPSASYLSTAGTYHEFDQDAGNQDIVAFRSRAANGTQYGLFVTLANDQNDTSRYFLYCQGGGVQRASFYTNGGLYNYSANNVNLASDERLKKDISPLATTWDKVKQIEVVNFRYKDCAEGDPLLYGVIAQQVQPIVPELVVVTQEAQEATEDKEATPEYFGIREQPMYWLAIKALQEAMERIETLETRLNVLEGN